MSRPARRPPPTLVDVPDRRLEAHAAELLLVEENESEDLVIGLLLWLDVAGHTVRYTLSAADARRLREDLVHLHKTRRQP
jgi:hypothetical protein